MENKEIKSNNGIIIGVMAFIIIALAGLCIYLLFIKKNESVVDNNNNNQQQNDNYSGKKITLNGETFYLKSIDGILYVNDKKIENIKSNGSFYVTNSFALIVESSNQCGENIKYALDENGNVQRILNNGESYSFYYLDEKSEIITASGDTLENCLCTLSPDNECNKDFNVEFIYSDGKVKMIKVG